MRTSLAVTAVLFCLALPAVSQELRVEAERFADSGNLSQLPIQGVDNPSCSGGVSLVGLDLPGEWTLYDDLTVPRDGGYTLTVHYRGERGAPVLMRLSLEPLGRAGSTAAEAPSEGVVELSLPGNGFG